MDLQLKISADTAAASAAFKDMAASSDFLAGKIKKLGEDMGNDSADKFINQQKLAGIAMQAVGKDTEGLTKQHAAYERQIQNLIKSGIDPAAESVQKLQKEYVDLTKKIEQETAARKVQENAWKVATGALAGLAAGVGAFVGASIKSASAIEDMTAAFTPMMGSTEKAADLVKQLNKEAITTPFELDKISKSVKRLLPAFAGDSTEAIKAFRMIGDTAGGNAQSLETMTAAYSNVKMTGKASMEDLNRIANSGVPIFTELAKSQNKSVAEIRQMTSDGKISADVLTGVFRTMTSEGGLFFKGMETSAFTFSSTILGIQENIGLVAGEIGQRFLPIAKDMADKFAEGISAFYDWISQGDNLTKLLDTLTYALAGVAGGLVAFLVVAKGAAIIEVLTTAFKGLTAAIAANPIGVIAVVVTAVLIPALIALWKNWDTVSTYLQQGIEKLKSGFTFLGAVIKGGLVAAIEIAKASFISVVDLIYGNLLRGVGDFLALLSKIPYVGEAFKTASDFVSGMGNSLGNMAQASRDAAAEAIQNAKDIASEEKKALDERLADIDTEARARRAAIEAAKNEAAAADTGDAVSGGSGGADTPEALAEKEKAKTAIIAQSLQDRLNLLAQANVSEQALRTADTEAFQQFLTSRLEAEGLDGEARIAFLQEQRELLLAEEQGFGDRRVEIEAAIQAAITAEQEKQAAAERALLEERMGAITQFTGGMGALLDAAGKDNREAAIAARVLAAVEAGINTALAVTKALSASPPPFNYIAAAGVLAMGIAQQVKIAQTPIPSAETGGRFLVPNDTSRVDGTLMRVNANEQVDITPAGQNYAGNSQTFNLVFDGQVLASAINRLARAGELPALQLAGNL